MASVKPLHLAKTLEELNKKVDKSDKLKQSTPKVLCRLADKVLLKAQDELLNGDEEQAYILYMRFIDMYKIIFASKEYKQNKEEIKKLLPTSKVTKALDKAEALSKQLQERYSTLNDPGGSADSKEDQVVPSSPKSHPQTSQPLLPIPSTSSQGTGPGDKDKGSTSQGNASLHPITPKKLYQLLTQQSEHVLVLDCRPRSEFNASHPDTKKFPQWLCLPEEMVRNGVSDSAVMSFLSVAGKDRWRRRGSVGVVVLVDDHSTMDKLGDTLLTLKDALTLFGSPPVTSDLAVLEGGYGLWHVTYGVTCVGKYRRQPTDHAPSSLQSSSSSGNETTASMDYPAFPDMPEAEMGKGSSDEGDEDEEEVDTPTKAAVLKDMPTSFQTTPTPMETDAQFNLSSSSSALPPGFMGVPAPLPLPPTTIPVALSLEGESGLMAPTLSSTDDLYTNYPQLLMGGGAGEEPEEVETFTEPVQEHYGQQQRTGYPQPMEQQQQYTQQPQYAQQPQAMEYQPHPQQQQQQPMEYQPHPQQVQQQGAGQQHYHQSVEQQSHPKYFQQPVGSQPHPQPHPQPAGTQPHPQFVGPQHSQPQGPHPQPHPKPEPHSQPGPQPHPQLQPQSVGPHQQPYNVAGGNFQQVPQPHDTRDARSVQDPRQVPQNPHWPSDRQAPPTLHAAPTHPEAQPTAASRVHPGQTPLPTQPPPSGNLEPDPPGTVHGTPIQRITSGPMPHTPSYDVALTLPSLPPPEQPLPPPVSTLQGQSGHVTESSGHVTATSNQPISSSSSHMTEATEQVPGAGRIVGVAEKAAISEASSQLREETERVMKLRNQMESEMARLASAREAQEAAARRLAQDQAELQAQREQHQRTMEQERKDFERMKKQYEQEVESMVAEKQRWRTES